MVRFAMLGLFGALPCLLACTADDAAERSGVDGNRSFGALTPDEAEKLCQWRFSSIYRPSHEEECTLAAIAEYDDPAKCRAAVPDCVQRRESDEASDASKYFPNCDRQRFQAALDSCPEMTVSEYERCVLARERSRRERAHDASCDDDLASIDEEAPSPECVRVRSTCLPGF